MSRIGKQPIMLPKGVKARVEGRDLLVEGPKGKLSLAIDESVQVTLSEQSLTCALQKSSQTNAKARYGLTRSLLANIVKGVTEGFTKDLEVIGVGYRAQVKGNILEMSLGFSHPIHYTIPQGIVVTVDKQTKIKITGVDKHLVGQTAAEIRMHRVPEPYKGKGIKYSDEIVRRKAGKAAGAGASSAS